MIGELWVPSRWKSWIVQDLPQDGCPRTSNGCSASRSAFEWMGRLQNRDGGSADLLPRMGKTPIRPKWVRPHRHALRASQRRGRRTEPLPCRSASGTRSVRRSALLRCVSERGQAFQHFSTRASLGYLADTNSARTVRGCRSGSAISTPPTTSTLCTARPRSRRVPRPGYA